MSWKKLLVALDGSPFSDGAARLAVFLARKLGAAVEGVHVVDTAMMDATFLADLSGSVGFQPFLNLTGEMREALRGIAETVAADFRGKLDAAGVSGSARVAEGIVVHELLEASQRADVLFLGTLGAGSRRGQSLGGHADSLLRKLAIPAVACPAGTAGKLSKVLAAYDGSEKSERALSAAGALAGRTGASLDVLTVEIDPAEIDRRRRAASRAGEGGALPRFEAVAGHPDEEILRRAPDHDLVALGSHGHGRIIEMVLGSTTERVLRRSPVPVLCVP